MIIRMKTQASPEAVATIIERIRGFKCSAEVIHGREGIDVIGVVGDTSGIDPSVFEELDEVLEVIRISRPYKRVSREYDPRRRTVRIGSVVVGGSEPVFMAGPCSIESRDQILRIAQEVKEAGAQILRGGAYKPRTSPYSFQGLGREGLEYMKEAGKASGLPIVTEATGTHRHLLRDGSAEEKNSLLNVVDFADAIQVGARNMKSYGFLQDLAAESGRKKIPILLKRGEAATISEFLLAAEYIVANGNPDVILCLRGIRTFEEDKFQRYTSDVAAVAVLKKESNLPVVFDPSHATGFRDLVPALSFASMAAGADGLIIEAHYAPQKAASDGSQTVTPETLASIIRKCRSIPGLIA